MDYSLEMSYNSYLLESMLQQGKMETYIQEALILTEGVDVVNRLTALNEGVGGKIKEVYDRFIAFIKKIFAKFTENMTKIFDTNKGWLEKYQKIILNKAFTLDVECKAYQLDRIIKYQIPVFNYSQLNDKLVSKGAFMNHIFGTAFPADSNTDDLNGWLKAHYCNDSDNEVKLNNPNMRELYDYCHDFKDVTMPKLKQYQSNTEKSANNARSLINTAISNTAKAAEANPQQGTAEQNLFDTGGKAYSRLLEVSINDPDKNKAKPEDKAPSSVGDNSKKFSTNAPDGKNTTGGETADTAAAAVNNDSALTETKVNEIIGVYTSVATAIAGSALTIAEAAYKDYMKILRAHVKKYVGDDSAANNTSAAVAQDHRGEQPPASDQPPAAAQAKASGVYKGGSRLNR